MMHLTVLGSGSSGNSALITTPAVKVLVDVGLSAKQIVLRLEAAGVKASELDGILLTHEHGDHTAGLVVLCKQLNLPIYATALTQEVLDPEFKKGAPRWKVMQTGSPFSIKDLTVECFPVPHDAVDPVGFVLRTESARLGFLSDVGHATHLIRDRLRGADTLFIEANYDTRMLEEDTKRPWSTKQRISSRHGHLSNEQAAALVGELAHEQLHQVVLGHLSSDCNTPEVAVQHVREALAQCPHELGHVDVWCADRGQASATKSVRPV
jgi:phosphoribosyl 1,2-cyclic phosphodiesterase